MLIKISTLENIVKIIKNHLTATTLDKDTLKIKIAEIESKT